jgi:hypothetical protein
MKRFTEFKDSMLLDGPPVAFSVQLQALWYDGKGEWDQAHTQVDDMEDAVSCWVHAYLHRKEGDNWNADYWYRKANKKRPGIPLQEEWEQIVKALL